LGSSDPRSHKRAYDKSGESRAAIINLVPVGPSKCLVAEPSTTGFLTDRTVTTPATDDPATGRRSAETGTGLPCGYCDKSLGKRTASPNADGSS
jgi:hypothetical protein